MGLTTSMFTALSGMNANQFRIDTVGDNIANVNTTAFKANRAMFENQFALTIRGGTAPGPTTGGTNPYQIGLGAALGSIQRNFLPGSVETTGVPTDLAVEGNGLFVVRTNDTMQAYTRDGGFKLDADNNLVTTDGFHVQGYGVDDDFAIIDGALTDLTVPLGTLTAARATSSGSFDGNLNASGPVASQGTILLSQLLEAGPGSAANEDTLLTNLFDPADVTNPLFAEGDVITLANVKKGDRKVPEADFTVAADSTLGDFLQFMTDRVGLNDDPAAPGNPGITVSDADPPGIGVIVVEGNVGTENALSIDLASIRSTNVNFPNPFSFTQTQEATGESLFTSFLVYDSLGTPLLANLTLTLEQKTDAGITWRYYAESYDDTDASPVLGPTGTLTFDTDGRLVGVTNDTLQIDRSDTGALTPLAFTLDFSNVTGLVTQESAMVMTTQDGFASGTLTTFSVGDDGVITGTFSNGLTRNLGQVVLATFTNYEGLIASANNLYLVGPNSGNAIVTVPATLGAGRILGGTLELSNVDLTREFIGLITASTGFSASGRVLSTSNDLLNELLLIAR